MRRQLTKTYLKFPLRHVVQFLVMVAMTRKIIDKIRHAHLISRLPYIQINLLNFHHRKFVTLKITMKAWSS